MKRQGGKFSTWGFFWFGPFRETNEGNRMTGRWLVMSFCFSLSSLLAPWTFDTLSFTVILCLNEHIVWICRARCEHARVSKEQGFGLGLPLCLVGCFIKDHQQSSLIPPLMPCLCFISFPTHSIHRFHFLLPRCLRRMLCDERPIKWKRRILTWK